MGRELLRGPPVPVQGGRQVLELDRLTPSRSTDQQRDKGGDDEAGHSFIPPVILPSHVSFYGGRGSLSPYRRDGSCEPSYAFYDTLLWNVFGNIALTPAYQLYGDLPSLLNSR